MMEILKRDSEPSESLVIYIFKEKFTSFYALYMTGAGLGMFNQPVSSPMCFQQLVVSILKTRKEFWDTFVLYKTPDVKKTKQQLLLRCK